MNQTWDHLTISGLNLPGMTDISHQAKAKQGTENHVSGRAAFTIYPTTKQELTDVRRGCGSQNP